MAAVPARKFVMWSVSPVIGLTVWMFLDACSSARTPGSAWAGLPST